MTKKKVCSPLPRAVKQTNLSAQSEMQTKKNDRERPEVQYGPRLVGDIITGMFLGNSPLAKGYRKYLATKENGAEKGGNNNG